MEKQITFEGTNAFSKALAWVTNLAECFDVKKVIIKQVKQSYDWRGDKVRVNVRWA